MKISHILLERFKRFNELEISFTNKMTGDIADQFLILGDNGSGKTTILQAIALCLSMASGKINSVREFDWLGWVPGRYEKWGTPVIELKLHFSEEEIQTTKRVARKWIESREPELQQLPAENKQLILRLEGARIQAIGDDGAHSPGNLLQLKGRHYATQLLKTVPWVSSCFDTLPGFFWFDQFRNLASPLITGEEREPTGRVSYDIGVSRLRRYLNNWKLNQLTGARGGKDWLSELETNYKKVFPDRSFSGLEPMHTGDAPAPEDYYFMLSDGNHTYDIEEMSAGEQSVFPLLIEFVRMQIRNSIVLIDEIDLNLHPPLAQSLVGALPTIGPACQFIFTTHSDSVASIVSPDEIYRIKGGKLCL